MTSPWILGINPHQHNGAAVLIHGDEVVVGVQEERLSGRKRARLAQSGGAIRYCLDAARITAADLDLVVAGDGGLVDVAGVEEWLEGAFPGGLRAEVLHPPHHLCHAISVYALSGFEETSVLVIDGGGSGIDMLEGDPRCLRYARGGGDVDPATRMEYLSFYTFTPDSYELVEKHLGVRKVVLESAEFMSLGHMWNAAANAIFGDFWAAGKVMGLAPYGKPGPEAEELVELTPEGVHAFSRRFPSSLEVPQPWRGLIRPEPLSNRRAESLAANVQAALERILLETLRGFRNRCPSPTLAYSGGVALNSVANERIVREAGYEDVYIAPWAEDCGISLGAAFYGLWHLEGQRPGRRQRTDAFGKTYTGPEVEAAIAETPCVKAESREVIAHVVDLLCSGAIVGWFQGGSEFGPRALGHRSILCDPRHPDAKDILNRRVKHREEFRPFAPVVLIEKATEWFDVGNGVPIESPFMLRVCSFRPEVRDRVPGVVHVDGTGRYQTLTLEDNGDFYRLVEAFHEATGVPIVLNTSFNVAGEAIVETPQDALWCMLGTGIDAVAFPDVGRVVTKAEGFRSVLDLYPSSGELPQPPSLLHFDGTSTALQSMEHQLVRPLLRARRRGQLVLSDVPHEES